MDAARKTTARRDRDEEEDEREHLYCTADPCRGDHGCLYTVEGVGKDSDDDVPPIELTRCTRRAWSHANSEQGQLCQGCFSWNIAHRPRTTSSRAEWESRGSASSCDHLETEGEIRALRAPIE